MGGTTQRQPAGRGRSGAHCQSVQCADRMLSREWGRNGGGAVLKDFTVFSVLSRLLRPAEQASSTGRATAVTITRHVNH